MVGKNPQTNIPGEPNKKNIQEKNGKKHTHTHTSSPKTIPFQVRDGFVFFPTPPDKSPRIFWDFVGLLQFGGSGSSTLSPPSRGIWTRWKPNEDVVAARKDDLISKWLGTRRDQPAQEAQEAEPPKPEPRRLISWGGNQSGLLGVMKLGPPHFFWGGGGRQRIHTCLMIDFLMDFPKMIYVFLGLVTHICIYNEPCFVNYGAGPSKLT